MREPAKHAQHDGNLRVAFLRFGVEHLHPVEEQQDLAAGELQPRQRLRGDVAKRAPGPEARHLGRRERAADGFFRDLLGVEPLELRGPSPEPDRRIGAVGARIVADVEVRSELRGGEIETAIDGVVACNDGREDEAETDGKGGRLALRTKPQPDGNNCDQQQAVFARQREARHCEAQEKGAGDLFRPAATISGVRRLRQMLYVVAIRRKRSPALCHNLFRNEPQGEANKEHVEY